MALIKTPGGEFYVEDSQFDVDYTKNVVTIIGNGSGTGDDATFVFNQHTPSSTWKITHNMNKFPSVSIVDSGGNIIIGNIFYIDRNNIELTFNGSFSGSVYLN